MTLKRIGEYRVLDQIASGSQGAVYRAYAPTSNRIVAVKVLHPTFGDDEAYTRRFQREAAITASIDHPNIIRIFEIGEEDDQHFMVMELLPESLDNLLRVGVPPSSASRFTAQIADGLQVAHHAGIVHRDIKPQNILVGSDGLPKITDFGIARSNLMPRMTATGHLLGTPSYMSPEQVQGLRPDHRSDIYSLGCLYYELLTGEVPFEAPTVMAVLRLQVEEEPRSVRSRNSDISKPMASIVERAMAKEPGQRYQSIDEMAYAIRDIVPMDPPAMAATRPTDTFIVPALAPEPQPPTPVEPEEVEPEAIEPRATTLPLEAEPEYVPPVAAAPDPLALRIVSRSLLVAGNGSPGFAGDEGPANGSLLNEPRAVAVADDGAVYIADTGNHRVRRIDPDTGFISTVAGTGEAGLSGDGNAATEARLNGPRGVCVSHDGSLFISDTQNNLIRRVNPGTGIITTIAGNGKRFFTEHRGVATDVSIGLPIGVDVTPDGRFLVVVGTGGPILQPYGVRQDRPHGVHIVDLHANRLWKLAGMTGNYGFSPDGTEAQRAHLNRPRNVAIDKSGNVYIADVGNNRVRKVDSRSLTISTVAGNGRSTSADDYDGHSALMSPISPLDIAIGPGGDLFILERSGRRIRRVDELGRIWTVFGGYSGTESEEQAIKHERLKGRSLAVDSDGEIWLADAGNHVLQVIKSDNQ